MEETTNTHFICLTMVLFPDSPAPGVMNRKNTEDDLFTCRRKVNKNRRCPFYNKRARVSTPRTVPNLHYTIKVRVREHNGELFTIPTLNDEETGILNDN